MSIETLFENIKREIQKYVALAEEYGNDDPMVKHFCAQIYGMQKAFALVAGVSYTDYLINSTKLMGVRHSDSQRISAPI